MYKAIQAQTGEEIIILHPDWLRRIQQLREMDRADLLVCQGCQQALRVKAGPLRRPHFAHKHLKACSYGSESPEILTARAVLYEWLLKQFGPSVTLEKKLAGTDLPRPVDCWVEGKGGPFAYWIIESGIRAEQREEILTAFQDIGVNIHWVFLKTMLCEEKKEFHSLLLTPTERAFLQTTPFDEMLGRLGETRYSLHYLDEENGMVTTYRGLILLHSPNWYKGSKKTTRLAEMTAHPGDGEFLHPGELARLAAFRQKRRRLETKQQAFAQREAEWARRLSKHSDLRAPDVLRLEDTRAEPGGAENSEELQCVQCGKMTTNYWNTFFDEHGQKMCRCRDCLS